MMRALWTSGLGMISQQFNVDVISNNLANVNTTGYKKEKAEFKDLLYETMDRAYNVEGNGKPVNLQVGHGAVVVATVKDYSTGNFEKTDGTLDFAIDGEGFFALKGPKDNTVYTRDGSFKVSINEEGSKLTTSEGWPVLDESGNEIVISGDVAKFMMAPDGSINYINSSGEITSSGQKLGLFKFPNKYGLESVGSNCYQGTSASGEAVLDSELGAKSTVSQGYLESSNVQVVEEMVKLIVAQRAYEVNSKAIQSADEMLGMANNLRR